MKILVAVCGSISAYKVLSIITALTKNNYEVHIITTKEALKYVTEDSIIAICNSNRAFYHKEIPGIPVHIEVTDNLDLFLLFSATANTIGKIANGIGDNLVTDSILALSNFSKKILVPAMNTRMWENKIVQNNIEKLKNYNWYLIEPEEGQLACGTIGKGKLPKTKTIIEKIKTIKENK